MSALTELLARLGLTNVHLRRPSTEQLEQLLSEQDGLDVTYAEVGATLGPPPAGYHHLRAERTLGADAGDFRRGADAIRDWAAHRAMSMLLAPSTPTLDEGSTMAFALPLAGAWVSGACRIVRVVDTDVSFGFAYGTLPHHPERGEEAFLVHRRDDGTVVFEIVAFSRPATLPTRLLGPIGRRLQRRSFDRYLDGYVEAARAAT
ncbi:MAG: DUF1990 domain-containing protein [Actinomycetota bacterium]